MPGYVATAGLACLLGQAPFYELQTKTVRCVECPPCEVLGNPEGGVDVEPRVAPPALEDGLGLAGSSARREYERRKAKDEERLRQKWGKLGGIAVAFSDEKQSTKAWAHGAAGEERLGVRLDSVVSESIAVLHDRRIPGSKANIDHIAVTAAGVVLPEEDRAPASAGGQAASSR